MAKPRRSARPRRGVPLARALSKLGILSRARALAAIRGGRVTIDGRVITDPLLPVVPERVRVTVDGEERGRSRWRTIVFHKPRGVVTTTADPQGRSTIYDVLGEAARGLVAVGRLDFATTGLLLLTSDTRLAAWITDPKNAVPRIYIVSVRGRIDANTVARLTAGIVSGANFLQAHAVTVRKTSGRESHLTVELREGKNREVRRLFDAVGYEVTRLRRVALGGLNLGSLASGAWRELTPQTIRAAFPGAPVHSGELTL